MLVNQFCKPCSLQDAVEIMGKCAAGGIRARVIAGGTDLTIALRERAVQADTLVDVSDIPEMNKIFVEDNILHVGAACKFSVVESSPDVLRCCPMLAQAASTVGAPTIRSRATVGGNVANAATAADSIPALMAADAKARIVSASGEREAAISDIVIGVNKSSLGADEILAELLIPVCTGSYTDFEKVGRRKALAISRINLGVKITLSEDKTILSAAVAVGAVGKTAYRVKEAEDFLKGRKVNEETVQGAADVMDETVARNLQGRKTTPYKRKIAAAVLKRALAKLMEVC